MTLRLSSTKRFRVIFSGQEDTLLTNNVTKIIPTFHSGKATLLIHIRDTDDPNLPVRLLEWGHYMRDIILEQFDSDDKTIRRTEFKNCQIDIKLTELDYSTNEDYPIWTIDARASQMNNI